VGECRPCRICHAPGPRVGRHSVFLICRRPCRILRSHMLPVSLAELRHSISPAASAVWTYFRPEPNADLIQQARSCWLGTSALYVRGSSRPDVSAVILVGRTLRISCEAVPASERDGAGMRRHVLSGNHAAESFVSFMRLFDRAPAPPVLLREPGALPCEAYQNALPTEWPLTREGTSPTTPRDGCPPERNASPRPAVRWWHDARRPSLRAARPVGQPDSQTTPPRSGVREGPRRSDRARPKAAALMSQPRAVL